MPSLKKIFFVVITVIIIAIAVAYYRIELERIAQIRESISKSEEILKQKKANVREYKEKVLFYKTKEGMILAFKMDGQKNFIYSKSLGKYYHENTIRERIERCVKRRGMSRTERRMERILNDDGKLKKLYDVDSFNEIGLREWAKKENRKIKWDTLHELHERGFSTSYELDKYLD